MKTAKDMAMDGMKLVMDGVQLLDADISTIRSSIISGSCRVIRITNDTVYLESTN